MVEELKLKDRLEGLIRVMAVNPELAGQLARCMVDEIDLKVEEFEREYAQ